MLKFCNTNKTFGKEIKNTLWNMGCLKNDRSIVFWQLLSKMIFKNDRSIVFWELLSKMIFKKKVLISFWCWSNAIISSCWFSWLVLLVFRRFAILLFSIILFAKTVESLPSQNATICFLFESLHSNYEK